VDAVGERPRPREHDRDDQVALDFPQVIPLSPGPVAGRAVGLAAAAVHHAPVCVVSLIHAARMRRPCVSLWLGVFSEMQRF